MGKIIILRDVKARMAEQNAWASRMAYLATKAAGDEAREAEDFAEWLEIEAILHPGISEETFIRKWEMLAEIAAEDADEDQWPSEF